MVKKYLTFVITSMYENRRTTWISLIWLLFSFHCTVVRPSTIHIAKSFHQLQLRALISTVDLCIDWVKKLAEFWNCHQTIARRCDEKKLKVLRSKLFLLAKADCNRIVADLCKNSERITDGYVYCLKLRYYEKATKFEKNLPPFPKIT